MASDSWPTIYFQETKRIFFNCLAFSNKHQEHKLKDSPQALGYSYSNVGNNQPLDTPWIRCYTDLVTLNQ